MISSSPALKKFTALAASQPWVAVDTEFMRRVTYFPQLCLVQLALPSGRAEVIDTLAPIPLTELWQLLNNKAVLKIFHAPSQDIEALYAATKNKSDEIAITTPPIDVSPLFDTQIAAQIAGYGKSLGLTNLVRQISDLPEPKDMCVSDWAKRPMSQDQIAYAENDVKFVREAYLHLTAKLEASGKLAEAHSQSSAIAKGVLGAMNPSTAWERLIKRKKISEEKITTRAKDALKKLAYWREMEAITRNIPRQWVIKDPLLWKIAKFLPKDKLALATKCNAPPKFVQSSYGRKVLRQVDEIRKQG